MLQTSDTYESSQMDSGQPSPPTLISRKRQPNDVLTQAVKKFAFDRFQKASTNMETESSYQKFSNFLASELEEVEKNHGATAAKKIQRKLNVCLINCLDELETATQKK